jgi:nucleoside-diphosphate-sugar epimerase
MCADITAARQALGWEPAVELDAGLQRVGAGLSRQPRR